MKHTGIIDAIEEQWVVVEIDGETIDYPIEAVQGDIVVGDVVTIKNGLLYPNKAETDALRKEIESLMDELWED